MKFPSIALLARPIKHQVSATGALERGLRAAGYRTRASYDLTAQEPVVICWSWGKAVTVRRTNPSAIICCMDHGYTRHRSKFINTGWSIPSMLCGLNGFAEHAVVDDGGERLRRYEWNEELRFAKLIGLRRALILGQVYGDAMIRNQVSDYGMWLRLLVDRLASEGWETTFRPHPVMLRRGDAMERYGNLGRASSNPDLWTDLGQNYAAYALNSNGLVAAYLEGLVAVPFNVGSMLSPIMNGLGEPVPFEKREPWFQRLAWTQWTVEELEDGTWLKHHAPILHRLVETGRCTPWHTTRLP